MLFPSFLRKSEKKQSEREQAFFPLFSSTEKRIRRSICFPHAHPLHLSHSMRASLPSTRAQALCGAVRVSSWAQAIARPPRATARRARNTVVGSFSFDDDLASKNASTSSTISRRARSVAAAASASPSSSSPAPAPSTPAKVNKSLPPAISLTESALRRCLELKKSKNLAAGDTLFLRVGVRSGGCNGMSYTMDFTEEVKPDDHVFEASTSGESGGAGKEKGESSKESVKIVCDPKSLLFLFGLQLDYSDALIGGGFSFQNPNAEGSCGCGKSFNV